MDMVAAAVDMRMADVLLMRGGVGSCSVMSSGLTTMMQRTERSQQQRLLLLSLDGEPELPRTVVAFH